jgi:hypothetical protein
MATEKANVYEAFAAAMQEVQAVTKDSRANVGGGYNFRGVDAVMTACGRAFRKTGVFAVPSNVQILTDERVASKAGGLMHNITLGITWRVYGPDGSFFEGYSAGESFDSGDKATAKAHSVAYRTFLLQALCLPTDEPDPDEVAYERAMKTIQGQAIELGRTCGLFKSPDELKEFARDAIGTDKTDNLTDTEAQDLIDAINKKKGNN